MKQDEKAEEAFFAVQIGKGEAADKTDENARKEQIKQGEAIKHQDDIDTVGFEESVGPEQGVRIRKGSDEQEKDQADVEDKISAAHLLDPSFRKMEAKQQAEAESEGDRKRKKKQDEKGKFDGLFEHGDQAPSVGWAEGAVEEEEVEDDEREEGEREEGEEEAERSRCWGQS